MGRMVGWSEMAVLLLLVLLVFGPGRFASLGRAWREAVRGVREEAGERSEKAER